MRKLISTFVICLAALGAMAQSAIEFKKTTHDFGEFKEDAGVQRYRFELKNIGDSDLIVTNAQASCGCTTPSWSKEPIKPGKTGFVEAGYDPRGRGTGPFSKTITVMTNSKKTPVVTLTIKGSAKEKEKTIADLYPREIGDFRINNEYLNMGRVYPNKLSTQTFKIYNDTNLTLTISPINPIGKHLTISVEPSVVKPKQTAEIKVTYDAKAKGDWGYMNDAFELKYSGGTVDKTVLYVVATIEEEQKKDLTPEQLKAAPRMFFNKKEHDFGVLKPGEIVNHEFTFTNTGGGDLLLHKTKASCGCTASEPAKKLLKPGESSSIKVTFNSTGKHDGDQSQSVTIYTNDPTEPTVYITIKAKVDSKKEVAPNLLEAPKTILTGAQPAQKADKAATTVAPVTGKKVKSAATKKANKTTSAAVK
jgi:hypothetical protein